MRNRVRFFRAAGVRSGSAAAALGASLGRLGRLVVPLVGLALGGCSSTSPATPEDMAMGTPADATVTPNPDALTTAYDDQFIGYWGIKAKAVSIQTLPGFGDTGSTTMMYSVGEFRRDGMGKLVLEQKECHVTVASEKTFIKTDVPDQIAETTPALTAAVQVYGQPGLLGFRRAEVAIGIGCRLTDPFKDPLPTDKTDAKIFDQDGDTKLGVTVLPQSPAPGEVYVAQRRKYSYVNGVQNSQTRLTGQFLDRSEQYILDANSDLLKGQVATKPVDAMSAFEMVKLGSQYTCVQLRAEADTLFTLK